MRVIRRLQIRVALVKRKACRPRCRQLGFAQPNAICRLFVTNHVFGLCVQNFTDLRDFISVIEVEVELVEVGHIGGEHAVLIVRQSWRGKECEGEGGIV